MDSKTFGEMALQLLQATNIPGSQIDVAVEFKRMAEALADSSVTITPTERGE